MAIQSSNITGERAPFVGDLRIKAWWKSNDYDRTHSLLIGQVDAAGRVVYNLTVNQGTYTWNAVDPNNYTDQLTPLMTIGVETLGPFYKATVDHMVNQRYMDPPSTTAAEDVERKMLKSENEFLKGLVSELAGTRKKESWRTTSTTGLSNERLDKMAQTINQEMERREYSLTGTPSTSGATGQSGPGQPSGRSALSASGIRGDTPIPTDTPSIRNLNDYLPGGSHDEQDNSESGQGYSNDRDGS